LATCVTAEKSTCRHVIGVAIHREASFEAGERHALGLQQTVIRADDRGELRSGGVAAHQHALRITAMLGDVLVHPAE